MIAGPEYRLPWQGSNLYICTGECTLQICLPQLPASPQWIYRLNKAYRVAGDVDQK